MVSILFLKCVYIYIYNINLIYFIGLRGGLVQASKRYAKANNAKTPDYDETKEKSWIVYQDCKYIFLNLIIFSYLLIFFKFYR